MSQQSMFSEVQMIAAMAAEMSAEAPAPPRLRRADRQQVMLRPVSLEQLLSPDHPARSIWAAVSLLDWSAFEQPIAARGEVAGRAATDPRILASLWLLAMTDNVGSGRRLEELCQSHAAYQWICGGVSVNYHSLNDFRTGHLAALDELFTQVLGRLMHLGVVSLQSITQDSLPTRAHASAKSFVTRPTLEQKLAEAHLHVKQMGRLADESPADAAVRQREAQEQAALERQKQLEATMSELVKVQAAKDAQKDKPSKHKEAKASTTDPEARMHKMPDGGYRPAHKLQLAQDPTSRAIVGVAVGHDDKQQGPLMLQQVMDRAAAAAAAGLCPAQAVQRQIYDGNYLKLQHIDAASEAGVEIYVPVPAPKNKDQDRYEPREDDSMAVAAWRGRMKTPEAQAIYQQRYATAETVNADLKCCRGVGRLLVNGTQKVLAVALWSALAYNLMHFGAALIG